MFTNILLKSRVFYSKLLRENSLFGHKALCDEALATLETEMSLYSSVAPAPGSQQLC